MEKRTAQWTVSPPIRLNKTHGAKRRNRKSKKENQQLRWEILGPQNLYSELLVRVQEIMRDLDL